MDSLILLPKLHKEKITMICIENMLFTFLMENEFLMKNSVEIQLRLRERKNNIELIGDLWQLEDFMIKII